MLKVGDKVKIIYYGDSTSGLITTVTYVCKDHVSCANGTSWGYPDTSLELIEEKIETARESLMF